MTREEAIERLKNYTQYRCGGVDLVALNMAIQALEQEPCNDTVSRGVFDQVMWERDVAIEQLRELGYGLGQKIEPCDDCVSRQALLDEFKDGTEGYDWAKWTRIDIIDAIEALPPVIPKREQGEWRKCNGSFRRYGCSNCRNYSDFNSKYCPHCGAEMR